MTARRSITVLGDGGWGTTLAIYLHQQGHQVTLWGAFSTYIRQVQRRRENPKFLPGVRIPAGVRLTHDMTEAVAQAHLIILAVPSQHLRSVVRRLQPQYRPTSALMSVAKGIEQRTLLRMSQVMTEELGSRRLAVLSGPNIAKEIAAGQPASTVVASRDHRLAREIQEILLSDRFRVYTSTDVVGVELGGALKNPLAIAAGMSDGLGFGANAKAALVTRGVVEMARLGTALGAKTETFWGLSGLGDLVTTCLSGRNHWLGEELGRGRSLKQILASTPMVIEGVDTSRAAVHLAKHHGVELPITEQVAAILFRGRSPRQAIHQLMHRAPRREI